MEEWEWISPSQRQRMIELMRSIYEPYNYTPPASSRRRKCVNVRCYKCTRIWTQHRRCPKCHQQFKCCIDHVHTPHDC